MAAGVKTFSRTFVWILMGLLIVGLAGFGAVNMTGTARTVAQVGNQTVGVELYAREMQREIRAIEAQTGRPMTMVQARELGIDQMVLARLIALASIDSEVQDLGISVGDENLQKEIIEIPAFQGPDGRFDREAYDFQLEQVGLNEAEFEADLRREAARTLVQGAVFAGVEMPATMTEAILDYIAARRSFTVATLDTGALEAEIPEPTDADLKAFYDANPDRFMLPETKRLTYALLSPAMLLDEVELDQEAVRRLYDEREAEYNQPERRLVERLAFADESAASSAMAQLEVGGTTFEQLVADRNLSLADVDLGDVTASDLGGAAEAVFAAGMGDVVGPLPSSLGPALFRVNGTLEARLTAFEDVADELRDELAAERARRLIEAQAESINDLLAGGATLEELGDEAAMEVGQIDWSEDAYEGIAAYDAFRAVASAVTEDDFPEVAFLEDGSIFALRLEEVLPERPEPLEEARDRVASAWILAETDKALRAEAETILTGLATSGDFTETGLPFRVENGLTRTAYLEGTPPDFMNQVFKMEPGEMRVISGPGVVLIVRLDETLPPEKTDELTQMRAAIAEQFNQALSQNLFDAFVRDAQRRARPMLDQQALNAVQSSFQ